MELNTINCGRESWGRLQNITSCINFLHTGRISLLSVAENIMTCLSWGVILKISWTSLRISAYIHTCKGHRGGKGGPIIIKWVDNGRCKITKWLEHLVTFIKDEMSHILEWEILLSGKSKYPSRCANHNMRALILQQIFMLPDVNSSIEDSNFNFRQIFAEPLKLMADLKIWAENNLSQMQIHEEN